MMPFDAAAEAGEEMRFDEAGDDADIGLGQVAVDQGRGAVAHGAELRQNGGVFGFVIEDAVAAGDFGSEQFVQFRRRVGAVGAELVQQRDLIARHAGQIIQEPRDQAVVGRGSRQVGEGDANAVARLDPLAQRAGGDRLVEGGDDGGALIGQTWTVGRLNDGGATVG
jgi:hypothetical protein